MVLFIKKLKKRNRGSAELFNTGLSPHRFVLLEKMR